MLLGVVAWLSLLYVIGFGVYGQCWGFNGGECLYLVRFLIA